MRAILQGHDRLPRARTVLATATVAGIVLGLLGPFGSYLNDGPALRVAYWVAAMWLGLLLNGAALLVTRRWAAPGTWRHGAFLAAWVLIASLPQTVATRLAALALWPSIAHSGPGWIIWYAQVATIGTLCVCGAEFAIRVLGPRPSAGALAPGPATPPAGPAERLPGDIIALQMEDHYVRIHTPRGSDLVLMPLGRAIAAVNAEGIRTHRSWWVARHAVLRVEGTPRSMCLRLKNGVVAPVSRSAVAQLRAAGWLGDSKEGQGIVRSTRSRDALDKLEAGPTDLH